MTAYRFRVGIYQDLRFLVSNRSTPRSMATVVRFTSATSSLCLRGYCISLVTPHPRLAVWMDDPPEPLRFAAEGNLRALRTWVAHSMTTSTSTTGTPRQPREVLSGADDTSPRAVHIVPSHACGLADAVDSFGCNALHWALFRRARSVVDYLTDTTQLPVETVAALASARASRTSSGNAALPVCQCQWPASIAHLAAAPGNAHVLRRLLSCSNLHVNARNVRGETPLLAVLRERLDAVVGHARNAVRGLAVAAGAAVDAPVHRPGRC